MTVEDEQQRYMAAMHAIQSGVAWKMQYDDGDTTPKHLRVGVNSAMLQYSALVKLLMDKGVITEEEHWTAMADAAEEECKMYERELTQILGTEVHLS